MSETLKSQFYEACPFWWWPVLWWQLALMEDYLAHIKANIGAEDMTYGLALGPHGRVHLIYLSDAAQHYATHGVRPAPSLRPIMLDTPQPEHARRQTGAGEGARLRPPVRAAMPLPKLYLDPG